MSEPEQRPPMAKVTRLPDVSGQPSRTTSPPPAETAPRERPWRLGLLVLSGLLLVVAAGAIYWTWFRPTELVGFAVSNGRIEATEIDLATRLAGRVEAVFAEEGDVVEAGQVLARIDVDALEAGLEEAEASLRETIEAHAAAGAEFNRRESLLRLARKNFERARQLFEADVGSEDELDRRRTEFETADASVEQAKRQIRQAENAIEVAAAHVQRLKIDVEDATIIAPSAGRVLYRLVEPGEVLAVGGKILTLVEADDAYMTIFLGEPQAARVRLGAEARIRLDGFGDQLWPASVSYVSPEAQFTPKQVETASEREKLVFKIKLRLPEPVAPQIKSGMRGLAYVRLDSEASWPDSLP